MKNIAVIGQGSAGILALGHFLTWLPLNWKVTSIHDPNKPILGIGESTNPSFLETLQLSTNFSIPHDLDKLDGTLKFGTEYKGWRGNDFVNPLLGSAPVAVHINTFKLKEYAVPRFKKIWGDKFEEILGSVDSFYNENDMAVVIVDGKEHTFDFVIDCSGFPEDYSEYNLIDNALLNSALVHNKEPITKDGFDKLYTGHIATKDGWMFEVPLISRTSYGYMFNTNITDIDTAKKNFSEIINVPEDELQDISFSFNRFYAKKIVNNKILKNGNRAIFFEPLFANSLFLYGQINRMLFDYIMGNGDEDVHNSGFTNMAKDFDNIISFHYMGGSTFDTDFWRFAQEVSTNKVNNVENFDEIKKESKRLRENKITQLFPLWVFSSAFLEKIDRNFEYYIFSDKEND